MTAEAIIDAELVETVSTTALEAITRAEVDMTISTAKKYPRSITKFKATAIAMATQSEEIAASCFYKLKRKNADGNSTEIEGPGIRLAEIMATSYGNLRFAGRIVGDDGKMLTAQGIAHDIENNIYASVEVKRRVTTRAGRRYGEDMIAVTAQAAISIAIRNAIYRVVPRAYVEEVMAAAKKVAIGDAATLTKRVGRALDWLHKIGVADEQVLAALGKPEIATLDVADLEKLTGWRTAIKDGETTIEDVFPNPATGSSSPADGKEAPGGGNPSDKSGTLAQKIRDRKKPSDHADEAGAAATPEPAAAPAAADPKAMLDEIATIARDIFNTRDDGDLEVDRATGGRCLTFERLVERGSADDVAAVLAHFQKLQKERRA